MRNDDERGTPRMFAFVNAAAGNFLENHELKTILTKPHQEFSRNKTHLVILNPRQ